MNLGIAAGALADIFLEDNERVTKSTDETLNTLAQLVIDGVKKRRKKLDSVEESMSRLEALGFKRPVAASIARGGLYAVNDAVTAAGKARDFGEDVNSYYVTQAKYSPDEFANYTRAEMAEAIVPVSNIKESADILTKGKRINTDRVNEAVGKYVGATPEASSIDVPVFAQDVSKMGGAKLDFTAQRNAALNFRRIITDRANIQGKEKSGLTLGFDASGNRTFMINNPQQYSKWVRSQIPDIVKLQEKRLPRREMEAFNSHIELITSNLENVKINDNPFDMNSNKAVRKTKAEDPNETKNIIIQNIDKMDYNSLKEQYMKNEFANAELFDQLYDEVNKQPEVGAFLSGRNRRRRNIEDNPVVNPPVEAASEKVTGASRRLARTGR